MRNYEKETCVLTGCVFIQEGVTYYPQSALDIAGSFNIFCLAVLNLYFDTRVIHSWVSSCNNLIV
jgi:hypothetical protein